MDKLKTYSVDEKIQYFRNILEDTKTAFDTTVAVFERRILGLEKKINDLKNEKEKTGTKEKP